MKIDWSKYDFENMSQKEIDICLNKILRQNRPTEHDYLTYDQLRNRRKKEVSFTNTNLTKNEKSSAAKQGIDLEY